MDTGLYYFQARFYDPAWGRFVQPDTIVPNPGDPQSLNRYSYALNNPAKFVDPSGHFSEKQLNDWYGDTWKQWSKEWQQLLLDAEGSQILGAQLGDLVLYGSQGNSSQGILVLDSSGLPALWDVSSKTGTPLATVAGSTPEQLGLYRIMGGETGAADEYFANVTSGTQSLSGVNGPGRESTRMIQLSLYSPASQGLPSTTTVPMDWFMGRNGTGYYVMNNRHYAGFQLSFSNAFSGGVTLYSLYLLAKDLQAAWAAGGMAAVGSMSAGPVAGAGASLAVAAYQDAKFRDVYQMTACPDYFGTAWCH